MSDAQTIVPGPARARPAVPAMQSIVAAKSHRFFDAVRSAIAAMTGIAKRPRALLAAITHVQRNVAQASPPATTETKYALKTAVRTTVV